MKAFEAPTLEIIRFDNVDIITESDNKSVYWEDEEGQD